MENNWYDDNFSPNNTQSAPDPIPQGSENDSAVNYYSGGYDGGGYNGDSGNGKKKKNRKTVSFTQFILCMLVVALFAGSVGAIITRSSPTADDQSALNPSITAPVGSDPVGDADGDSVPSSNNDSNMLGSVPPSSGLSFSNTPTEYSTETEIIQSCMSSVVGVDVEYISSTNSYIGESETSTGSGSGVILTADGYIVTNNHVVSGATKVTVHLQDGTEYEATIIGADQKTDLAVIKIDAQNLPYATLGSSTDTLVGEQVYAVGNPLGVLTCSVSRGIISGLDRTIEVEGYTMTLMQTDAAVNPGNSGGGLFNSKGELIGIVNAKSFGTDIEGIGFAIPVDSAKLVIMDLIDLGYVTGRPYLGISMQNISISKNASSSDGSTPNYGFPFGGQQYVNRIQVVSVEEGSASDKGGIMVNDIIVALDGVEITGTTQLSSLLYEYSAGDVVTITVQRGTENIDLDITLGERTKS